MPKKEQGRSLEAGIHKERGGIAPQVYQRRFKMTRVVPEVVEHELNERIHKMESLVGKYDSALFIDTDLTDSFQFPAMKKQVYMDNYAIEAGQ